MEYLFEFVIKLNFWIVCQGHGIDIMCHSNQRKISAKNRRKQQRSDEKERGMRSNQIENAIYTAILLIGGDRLDDARCGRVVVLRSHLRMKDHPGGASAYFSAVLERVWGSGWKPLLPHESAVSRMEVLDDKTRGSLYDERMPTTCTDVREVDGIVRTTTKKNQATE